MDNINRLLTKQTELLKTKKLYVLNIQKDGKWKFSQLMNAREARAVMRFYATHGIPCTMQEVPLGVRV